MGPGAGIGTRASPPTVKISTGIAGSTVSPLWRPSDYDTRWGLEHIINPERIKQRSVDLLPGGGGPGSAPCVVLYPVLFAGDGFVRTPQPGGGGPGSVP